MEPVRIHISGAPGAGKTELLREIGAHLQARGLAVTCTDAGVPQPLEGVLLLRRYEPRAVVIVADSPTRAELRRALRAYDLAGPLTERRRQALGEVLTLARQLTEE